MDNITHSLVGVALAETSYAVFRKFEKKEEEPVSFHALLWLASVIGNNFPDLDFLYAHRSAGSLLGYLLHHRGYTHTFLLALVQGVLIFFCFRFWIQKKKLSLSKGEWGLLGAVSVLGPMFHILLDSLNSYGVHPYWPFDNHWSYGDTFFIVEPWVWVTLLPLAFFSTALLWLRVIFAAFWFAALGLVWWSGYVLMGMALVVSLWAILLAVFFWKVPRRAAIFVTWLGFFFILFLFFQTSRYAKKTILAMEQKEQPGVIFHDLILMPFPSNIFCWGVVSVESLGPVASYRLRYGLATPFPSVVDFNECHKISVAGNPETPVKNLEREIHWIAEKQFDVEKLRSLSKHDCEVLAFLKFSRAPAFVLESDKVLLSDWRFDLRGRKNFSSFEFPLSSLSRAEEVCTELPSWIPPRADLLNGK